jgi:hypothetical protein
MGKFGKVSVLILVLACLSLPGLARAQDSGLVPGERTGKLVSCFGQPQGKWCVRPGIQLSALRIDLRSGDFSGIMTLAGSYGIEYDGIFSVDLSAGFKVSQDEAPNSLSTGVMLGFLNYFHVGVDMDFRDHQEPQYGLVIGATLPLSFKIPGLESSKGK